MTVFAQEDFDLIGRNIKRYREYARMAQKMLSEETHISLSLIKKLEGANSGGSISLPTLKIIADALGVKSYMLQVPDEDTLVLEAIKKQTLMNQKKMKQAGK